MVNRKLIRPNLAEMKEKMTSGGRHDHGQGRDRDRDSRGGGGQAARRRVVPPESTNAEAFYYLKQMNNQTPMVVVLDNGDELRGHIEWYDRSCLKVHRQGEPNLLVFKHCIKYLYKQEEENA